MQDKTRYAEFSLIKAISASSTFQVILFSLLTAVAAQIAFPVKPVPFTLQTMMVALSGAMLGARKGAYSQILYLLMGISGLPVFAQIPDGAIGIARLFGPTGGYLLAFPAAAYITGLLLEKNKSILMAALAMFLANALIIFSGVSYLYVFWVRDLKEAVAAGAIIFSLWTVIKVAAGTSIYAALTRKK
jgi:biotin transport system substrate-specific component